MKYTREQIKSAIWQELKESEHTGENNDRAYEIIGIVMAGLDAVDAKPVDNLPLPTDYPGSSYQNLFDYLHEEHGLTLLESEMDDIINVVHKFHPAGAVWVKCWEQKPDTHKVRFKDKHGNEFMGNYSKETGQYWAYGFTQAINDVIEWKAQDESGTPAAGREEDAVTIFEELWDEHSEYIDDDIDSLSRWAGSTVVDKEQFKTIVAKMWELFKQQREK